MEEDTFKKNMYEHHRLSTYGGKSRRRRTFISILSIVLFLFLLGVGYIYRLSLPPSDFPVGKIIQIPDGSSIKKTGTILTDAHVVRSPVLFQTFSILFSGDKGVRSGFYSFDVPISVVSVADKLTGGKYGIARVKVTIPEGTTVKDIGAILQTAIPAFNSAEFVSLAQKNEGYMFPETYFFFTTVTPTEVIDMLTEQFNKNMAPYQEEIALSGKSAKDIIIMASLIEKETNGKDDYEMISGILWNRIAKKMRLQVDATFIYTLGKGRESITPADIKKDTSAYNTYLHTGFPPTAIGNPGMRAILAALRPAKTDYMFYLHDKDGTIHYAKTFEQHKLNVQRYLR
jgi:UPF0755 protein